jgi:hypothetical protein
VAEKAQLLTKFNPKLSTHVDTESEGIHITMSGTQWSLRTMYNNTPAPSPARSGI